VRKCQCRFGAKELEDLNQVRSDSTETGDETSTVTNATSKHHRGRAPRRIEQAVRCASRPQGAAVDLARPTEHCIPDLARNILRDDVLLAHATQGGEGLVVSVPMLPP